MQLVCNKLDNDLKPIFMQNATNIKLLNQFDIGLPTLRGPNQNVLKVGEHDLVVTPLSCCQSFGRVLVITAVALASILIIPAIVFSYKSTYCKIAQFILEIKLGASIQGKRYDLFADLHKNELWPWYNLHSDHVGYKHSFAILYTQCRDKDQWDISNHIPNRPSGEEIAKLTYDQLITLTPETLFSIIDLLSASQAIQLIEQLNNSDLTLALYYFNANFAQEFEQKQEAALDAPIDQDSMRIAEQASNLPQISKEQFDKMTEADAYAKVEASRLALSTTYENDKESRWKVVNKKYLSNGIERTLTQEFLVELNSALRPEPDLYDFINGRGIPLGLRKVRHEVCDPVHGKYYLPGRIVDVATKTFITWFNRQLDQCDARNTNPVVFAALTQQKLGTIHPFSDGNGRTARLLADMVLRRYKLLPSTMKKPFIACFVIGRNPESKTPSQAVKVFAEGVLNTHSMLNP